MAYLVSILYEVVDKRYHSGPVELISHGGEKQKDNNVRNGRGHGWTQCNRGRVGIQRLLCPDRESLRASERRGGVSHRQASSPRVQSLEAEPTLGQQGSE